MVVEVETTGPLSREEFRVRFELTEAPVIMRGGARAWPAYERWSPAYLCDKLGDLALEHKLSRSHKHPDFGAPTVKEMFARDRLPFAEFMKSITTGDPAQRAQRLFTGDERFILQRRNGVVKTDEALCVLLEDVELLQQVPEDRLFTIWGWFSGPGVRTWLHYDNNGCHNLNAQVTGEKRCVLFPPSELSRMRPFKLGGANPAYNCSEIDVEGEALPADFEAATSFEATLHTGDLLFIPAWWFHTFSHVGEFNSNVNFWWKPEHASLNPVSARQAFLDAVAQAGLNAQSPAIEWAVLSRIDDALRAAASVSPQQPTKRQ